MLSRARRVGADIAVEPFPWTPVGGQPAAPHRAPQAPRSLPAAAHDDAAVERDAFAKGFAQGERAGHEAAAKRAEGLLNQLAQAVKDIAGLRGDILHRTERQVVQLVLAIAERVIHREVMLDRGLLLGMARAALDRLGEHGAATIRLHPDDYQAIGATSTAAPGSVQILADPSVARGGCQVQADFGFMDVSPEAQFRELARALLSDSPTSSADAVPSHGIAPK